MTVIIQMCGRISLCVVNIRIESIFTTAVRLDLALAHFLMWWNIPVSMFNLHSPNDRCFCVQHPEAFFLFVKLICNTSINRDCQLKYCSSSQRCCVLQYKHILLFITVSRIRFSTKLFRSSCDLSPLITAIIQFLWFSLKSFFILSTLRLHKLS